jgi:hypothetical protein
MIPAIAIATGLLAVLDDDNAPTDFDDLFNRAVAFGNPKVFLDRLSVEQRSKFLKKFLSAYRTAKNEASEEDLAHWASAIEVFFEHRYVEVVFPSPGKANSNSGALETLLKRIVGVVDVESTLTLYSKDDDTIHASFFVFDGLASRVDEIVDAWVMKKNAFWSGNSEEES